MMMRVALALALAASPALAERSLNGRTVTFRVVALDAPEVVIYSGHGRTVKVGEGVEFGLDREGVQNGLDVVPVEIDIGATRLELSYEGSGGGLFADTWFNGYELSFPTECALILGAHIDPAGTTLPVDDRALTVEPGRLLINVEGLRYSPTDRLAIDVEVGDCVLS